MTDPAPEQRPPDELQRLWAWFARASTGPLLERPHALLISGAAVLAAALPLGLTPAVFLNDMPDDALIPLDGAWRMAHGHRPHVDFLTPVGDLYYAILAMASWWTGPGDPRLLAVANAIVGLPVLLLAWVATRDRLTEPLRVAALIAVSLCAMSPRSLDSASLIGFNAMYNRWGWALSFVALCALLLPARRPAPADGGPRSLPLPELAVLAVCVVAVAWIKVTFLALIGAGAALSLVCVPENRRLLWGIGAGALITGLTFATPLGLAYLADLALAADAAAGGPGLLRGDRLQPLLMVNLAEIALIVAVSFALLRTARPAEEAAASRDVLSMVGVTGAGLLVGSQNNDATVPVLAVALLIGAVRLHAREGRPLPTVLAAAVAFALVLRPAVYDAGTIALHAVMVRTPNAPLYPEGALAKLRIPLAERVGLDDDGKVDLVVSGRIPGDIYDNLAVIPWPVDNPKILADAVALLDAHDLRGRRIASLTFSPYFPVLLSSPPPRGLPAWWDWQRTFGADWDGRACDALADTEVVLQPKVWGITSIDEENEACLESDFRRLDDSPLWTLWAREATP